MKKLTSISLIIMVMIFLGITSVAEARTGNTSDSSRSSSSKSRSTTSTGKSKTTKTTSATDSVFANIAKTNEAKKAWQERNKKPVDNTPVAKVPVPVQDNSTSKQLADIQRQIAEAKRQQQIIAAAQTAAQIALNNNKRPLPAPVTPAPTTTTPVSTSPDSDNSGGTSWFMIFLMIGGMVLMFFWFKKRNTSNTIYRL